MKMWSQVLKTLNEKKNESRCNFGGKIRLFYVAELITEITKSKTVFHYESQPNLFLELVFYFGPLNRYMLLSSSNDT